MKKIVALYMVLILMLTNCSIVFGKESTDVKIDAEVSEAVGILQTLNIFEESYDAAKDASISRAEFARYIAKALKIDDLDAPVQFSDTQVDSEVNILAYAGYIDAEKGKKYKPAENITLNEALTVIMRVLGYGEIIDANKGKANRNIEFARRLKLIDRNMPNGEVDYAEAGCMIFNMLGHDCGEAGITIEGSVSLNSGSNMLEAIYSVKRIEGRVVADETVSLYIDVDRTEPGLIQIGNKCYDYQPKTADELVGEQVVAYVQDKGGKYEEILYLSRAEDSSRVVVQMIAGDISDVKDEQLTYVSENGTDKRISFNNPITIYNGKADPTITERKLTEVISNVMQNGQGDVKIIKSKGDRDVVFVNAVKNIKITNFDMDQNLIYGIPVGGSVKECIAFAEKGASESGYTDAVEFVQMTDANGAGLTVDDITVGNILSVTISADKSVIKIMKCTETVKGKVQNIRQTGRKTTITIGESAYALNRNYANETDIKLGATGIFVLDRYGEIVGTQGKVSYDGTQFGYIYDIEIGGVFEKTVKIKVYDSVGTDAILKLKKKVKLDGVDMTAEAAYQKLTENGGLKKQGIAYRVDENDEISRIDTPGAVDSETENFDTLEIIGQKLTRKYRNSVAAGANVGSKYFEKASATDLYLGVALGYPISDKTTLMYLVLDNAGNVVAEHSLIVANFTNEALYNVELYSVDDSPFADYAIVYGSEAGLLGVAKKTKPMMIHEIRTGINNTGDVVGIISCGGFKSANAGSADQPYEIYAQPEVVLYINGLKMTVNSNDLSNYIDEGDLIMISGQHLTKNTCYSIRVVYDYSEDKIEYGWNNLWNGGTDLNNATNQGYGFADSVYTRFNGTYDQYLAYLEAANINGDYSYRFETASAVAGNVNARFAYGEVKSVYVDGDTRFVVEISDLNDRDNTDLSFTKLQTYSGVTARYLTYNKDRWEFEKTYYARIYDIVSSNVAGAGQGDRMILYDQGDGLDAYYFYKTIK